jgi:phenylacetate-coenzyme A ligase PaaK-like adenylate-forming protein
MPDATYAALRARHRADLAVRMAEHMQRLDWPRERLAAERQRRLRILLDFAKAASPWHRARLAAIDVTQFVEADLAKIPTMTKSDLMTQWSLIVTDPRLTRDVVDDYVRDPPENTYLAGRYHVLASGGSSGRRGTFVYDWFDLVDLQCMLARWAPRGAALGGGPARLEPSATVFAATGAHASHILPSLFSPATRFSIPASAPLQEIVSFLNEVRPRQMGTYASMWALLAAEAAAGRLNIPLEIAQTSGEPLLPEIRAAVESAWPVRVRNIYGASEGFYAGVCHCSNDGHLPDDLCIFEPVDHEGRPVVAGQLAAKYYFTNLYNFTLPIIRLEITDQITLLEHPCACGSAHRRVAEVLGRNDDVFAYGATKLHPIAVRTPLGRRSEIREYQVRQTPRGLHVLAIADDTLNVEALASDLRDALRRAGLREPSVEIETVADLPHTITGKVTRFVPLR